MKLVCRQVLLTLYPPMDQCSVIPSQLRHIWLASTLPVPFRKPSSLTLILENFNSINSTYKRRTFTRLWRQVGENVSKYKNFPRLIGECGGKNYHFVHPTADTDTVSTATIRAAFEFSGQKCSACSRAFIPESLWPKVNSFFCHVMLYCSSQKMSIHFCRSRLTLSVCMLT